MYIAFGIFVVIIAILLATIVIIQNPKGGMLNSSIGGLGNQILGASRSTETVEKITWYLAGTLMILCIGSVLILPDAKEANGKTTESSLIEETLKKNKNNALPSAPAMPVQQTTPVQNAPAQPAPASSAPATK